MPDEIGSRLREARMRAKIDINEVETHTKIRAKYLRAIENEEWDLLPGEVYVKSFLRTYGEYLGLDTRQLLDDFRRRYERPSDHELRPIAPLGRDRPARRRGVPPWLAIAAVLVLVVVALFYVGKQNSGSGTHTTTRTATKPRQRTHRRSRRARTHKAIPKSVKLQLQATGQVYVCLVNGAGRKLIAGRVFNIGEAIPTETASKLLLTLGNNNVTMKVNGAPVSVAASPGGIGYRLVPGARSLLPASQRPNCA